MSRKKKVLIIVAVVLFLFLLWLLVWFLNQKQQPIPSSAVVVEGISVVTPRAQTAEPSATTDKRIAETREIDSSLQSLAITFVERYGSYSTESDFANLYDVMDLMTASFRDETQDFIATARASLSYYGVTTRVLSVKEIVSGETSASLEVATQREESKDSPQNSEVKYQTLVLTCLKEDGVWKVSSALWQ